MKKSKEFVTIALPKGRILKEAVALFKEANIDMSMVLKDNRMLTCENKKEGLRFMILRAQDVPTYVEYGAADMGIVGKDVLMEQARDLYEPLDLGIGGIVILHVFEEILHFIMGQYVHRSHEPKAAIEKS